MRVPLLATLLLFGFSFLGYGQSIHELKKLKPGADFDNIYVQKIYSDQLVTSSLIWIKKEVKLHQHALHSEHVVVVAGKGVMVVGAQEKPIKKGDLIVIPKGTAHSVKVTSKKPLKVLSIQSPKFVGKDRIYL